MIFMHGMQVVWNLTTRSLAQLRFVGVPEFESSATRERRWDLNKIQLSHKPIIIKAKCDVERAAK